MNALQLGSAPEWETTGWFNTGTALTLASLRGRVVMMKAFQMLCPGCVSSALPQAQRVHIYFDQQDLAVVGLHTVFEHRDGQAPVSLEAFIHEYRLTFPIGVDRIQPVGRLPVTMEAYGMRGTPSTILIDRKGLIRYHGFGGCDDLALGARLATLIAEPAENCTPGYCEAPAAVNRAITDSDS